MIYGEESHELDFSKGLWLSDYPDVPEGFCSELINLQVSDLGTVAVRPSILGLFETVIDSASGLSEPSSTPGGSTTLRTPRYGELYSYSEGSRLNPITNGSQGLPIYIASMEINPGGGDTTLPAVSLEGFNNKYSSLKHVSVPNPVTQIVQYSDRLYFWDHDTGVIKITAGWDFDATTTQTLTTATVASSPTVATGAYLNAGMFTHKDRLFLFNANRLWFTDTAAPGGYPETWDIAVNFLDMPVRTINKAHVHNNTIYFFTSGGIYLLQVIGPPETWNLRMIDNSVKFYSRYDVAFGHNFFYLHHENNIYIYNGETMQSISTAINSYLDSCHAIGVFPYEEGCLVCAQQYRVTNTSPVLSTSRLFYFDTGTNAWSEITVDGYRRITILDSTIDISSELSNFQNTTYLTAWMDTELNESLTYTTKLVSFYVDKMHVAGDQILFTGDPEPDIDIDFSVKLIEFVGDTYKEKRIKYGYLNALVDFNRVSYIPVGVTVDGGAEAETQVLAETYASDLNGMFRLRMPGYVRRLGLHFSGTLTAEAVLVDAIPSPVGFKSVKLIYQTGRTEEGSSNA